MAIEPTAKEVQAKLEKTNLNEVKIGVRVNDIRIIPGKPRIKDGVEQVDGSGQLLYYPDRKAIDVGFMGGEYQCLTDEGSFDDLEIGKQYLMSARISRGRFDARAIDMVPVGWELLF